MSLGLTSLSGPKPPKDSASLLPDARAGVFLSLLCSGQAGRQALKLHLPPCQPEDGQQPLDGSSPAAVQLCGAGRIPSLSKALSHHLSEADNKSFLWQALRGLGWIRYVKILCN